MPTSVELRQQRARVVESMRAITETAEAADRGLSAEERQSYERHENDFTGLTERINRQEAEEQRSAQLAEPIRRSGQGPDDGSRAGAEGRAKEARAAFFQALRRGVNGLAPEQRALVENAAGEILVPEDLETEINRELPALTVVRGMVSQRTISSNRVRRRSLSEVSVGWGKLETGGQTLSDSMPGTPEEEYTYVEDLYGLAKIGEDELDDSDVNLEAYVRDSFTRAVAEAEDTAGAVGTGHANRQPIGFMTTGGGVPVVQAANGNTTVKVDLFKQLIYAVPAQYRRTARFAMASGTELALSVLKDGNGQYLWQQSVQAGRPNTFLGYAIENQEDIAAVAASAKVAAFGDFNAGYRLYDRAGMTVKVLDQLYAEDGMIGWKIRRRVGGDVVRPNALRILQLSAS
ncbi:phage major capsid protein [Streptomyces albipurpureus]|uniref:Phage major capsid protein n=1 Tax=Streptomyces albipurpureus TaxID=2897419 RepID=A0ABT0URD9_9ACTN|nr:phage major capsid protein [Streptomyces sp. CWNU-1]MCM2390190.1 phage major capsid protein [Streptomyces sp. CWNU-1]